MDRHMDIRGTILKKGKHQSLEKDAPILILRTMVCLENRFWLMVK
jgi:hypothetical protein